MTTFRLLTCRGVSVVCSEVLCYKSMLMSFNITASNWYAVTRYQAAISLSYHWASEQIDFMMLTMQYPAQYRRWGPPQLRHPQPSVYLALILLKYRSIRNASTPTSCVLLYGVCMSLTVFCQIN